MKIFTFITITLVFLNVAQSCIDNFHPCVNSSDCCSKACISFLCVGWKAEHQDTALNFLKSLNKLEEMKEHKDAIVFLGMDPSVCYNQLQQCANVCVSIMDPRIYEQCSQMCRDYYNKCMAS